MLSHLIREAILPPGCLLLALLASELLRRRSPRAGLALFAVTTGCLYLLSIAPVSLVLCRLTETEPPATPEQIAAFQPEAIVVLGGAAGPAPEYSGAAIPGRSSQMRVAYAIYLAKATALPILVTGGYGETIEQSEGWAMKQALERSQISVRWVEPRGLNTRQNAENSKALLEQAGVKKVLMVTSASHAGRAKRAFEAVGLQVLAAPTEYHHLDPWDHGLLLLAPKAAKFAESSDALRALLGDLWYRMGGGG